MKKKIGILGSTGSIGKTLINLIKKDKVITAKISDSKINNVFRFSKHLKNINYIYRRVFK